MTGLFVTVVATPCTAPFRHWPRVRLTLPGWGVFLFCRPPAWANLRLVIGFVGVFRYMPKPGAWLGPFRKSWDSFSLRRPSG